MKVSDLHSGEFSSENNSVRHTQKDMLAPMMLVMQELQESLGSALSETLEEMSMVMSGRLRENRNLWQRKEQLYRRQSLISLINTLSEEQQQACMRKAEESDQPEEYHRVAQLLAVASRLREDEALSEKKRLALERLLDELMTNKGWEVSLFGMLSLTSLDRAVLAQIKQLLQQVSDDDDDGSLISWFSRIANWPDRRKRLQVLLQAVAFELACCQGKTQKRRLAAVLCHLRRLLLFLGMEETCLRLEKLCQLPANTLLALLIDIIAESWLFSQWLNQRLNMLQLTRSLRMRLLHHLDGVITSLSEPCFNDEEQRNQILDVVREVKADQQPVDLAQRDYFD